LPERGFKDSGLVVESTEKGAHTHPLPTSTFGRADPELEAIGSLAGCTPRLPLPIVLG
jgi:hypothetical protein